MSQVGSILQPENGWGMGLKDMKALNTYLQEVAQTPPEQRRMIEPPQFLSGSVC